jgi:hypothetical protein
MLLNRKSIAGPVLKLCLAALLFFGGIPGPSPVYAADPGKAGAPEWNLAMIGADTVNAEGYRGQNVRVGVIDSGVNPHPDFADRLLGGHNYTEDAADPDDTSDEYGHGTRVAGLIAAVAPEAQIVPLKITNGGSVGVTQLCRAIYGAIDDFGCDVLNLSLGVPNERESLRQAVEYAAEKGVVIVAATGNDGTGEIYYPAAYDSVIGVSAADRSGAASVRSNHNKSVMIAAPGDQVKTASHRGGTVTESGCSYAVPHVSAAAAILKSIDGSLTSDEILRLLTETAADRGIAGYDEYYGYGILDIAGCVRALTEGAAEPGISYADCPGDGACPLAGFSDLDRAAWYHDGIHYALERGIMNGVGSDSGLFAPDAPTSRAMIVTILWRLAGKPEAASGEVFDDVPENAWYAKAVLWASSEHIAEGYGSARFDPDGAVTREQLAVILYRYAEYRGADPDIGRGEERSRYEDAGEVSAWAVNALQWATGCGLIGGVSENRLSPLSNASRAQTATILMRFARLVE